MSDLIDRQAAIDAVLKCGEWYEGNDEAKRGVSQCIGVLYDLPSAQQKETFEFGKWYDFERGYVLETTVHSFRILKDMEASSNE